MVVCGWDKAKRDKSTVVNNKESVLLFFKTHTLAIFAVGLGKSILFLCFFSLVVSHYSNGARSIDMAFFPILVSFRVLFQS